MNLERAWKHQNSIKWGQPSNLVFMNLRGFVMKWYLPWTVAYAENFWGDGQSVFFIVRRQKSFLLSVPEVQQIFGGTEVCPGENLQNVVYKYSFFCILEASVQQSQFIWNWDYCLISRIGQSLASSWILLFMCKRANAEPIFWHACRQKYPQIGRTAIHDPSPMQSFVDQQFWGVSISWGRERFITPQKAG